MPSDFPPVWSLPGLVVGYIAGQLPKQDRGRFSVLQSAVPGRAEFSDTLDNTRGSADSAALSDLWRLLYNDGPDPLSDPAPTAAQLSALIYDPTAPEDPPDADRGYRIFTQDTVTQTLTTPASTLAVWLGGLRVDDDFDILTAEIDLRVLCSADSETLVSQGDGSPDSQSETEQTCAAAAAMHEHSQVPCEHATAQSAALSVSQACPGDATLIASRSTLMAQALLAALTGLCLNGIGTVRLASADRITDDRQRCGYLIKMELDYVL